MRGFVSARKGIAATIRATGYGTALTPTPLPWEGRGVGVRGNRPGLPRPQV